MDREFVQAETFRPQRQPPDDPVIPDKLLSSTRPLVAPKGKIKRTPSREVSDPESEPDPTPVTVVGHGPPTFKVEISTPGEKKGFYIENIESRATVNVDSSSPVTMETPTTTQAAAPVPVPVPATVPATVPEQAPDSTITSGQGEPSRDGLDEFMKALSEIPPQKIGPFLVLIYLGAFVWAAAELDPAWLVLLTSLSSFVLFPILKV